MANQQYVDIDLYGRGFDSIFGPGAEEANKQLALVKLQAMTRFNERVEPGEYVDLDLYGRGDPRVFGHQSHIHTLNDARKHLKDSQRRKKERKFNRLAVVFPSGIKAVGRFAKKIIRRRSSSRMEEQGVQEDADGVEDDHGTEDQVGKSVEHDPEKEIPHTTETQEPLEEDSIQAVDCTPKRVKSKLPSEEERPHVENGHVLRVIKSFSSFEKVDKRTDTPGNVILAKLARVQKYSSLPVRETLLPVSSHSGSQIQVRKEIQDHTATHGASTTEDEVAKDILGGDDEDFQLSFSAPQTGVEHTSSDSPSTSSEEDLLARTTQLEHTSHDDEAGRSVVGSPKIKDLFHSVDTDGGSNPDQNADAADDLRDPRHDSRLPGDAKRTAQAPSSTEDEEFTEHVVPVTGLSFDDIIIAEDGASHSAIEPVAEESNDIDISSRGDSIIKIVESLDISFNDHSQHVMSDNSDETRDKVEATGVSTPVTRVTDNAIMETHEHNVKTVVRKGTSSSGTSSSTADCKDNGPLVEDARNEQHSEGAEDSDCSAKADSPAEDSDDVDGDSSEAETVVELVEDIVEADGVEEIEAAEHDERETSDETTVESSDHDASSEDDAGGDAVERDCSGDEDDADDTTQDDKETKTFWRWLGLFGAVMISSSRLLVF